MGKSSHWHECCILVYRCVYVPVCLLLCLSICLYLFTYLSAGPSYCYSFRTWHNRGNCTRPSDIKYSWQRDTEFQRLFLEVSTNHGMKYMRKCQYMLGENITGTSPLLSIKKGMEMGGCPGNIIFQHFHHTFQLKLWFKRDYRCRFPIIQPTCAMNPSARLEIFSLSFKG